MIPALIRTSTLLALLALAGCGTQTRLGTLNARYQNPHLPVHFRAPRDGASVAGYLEGNTQGPVGFHRTYQARAEPDQSVLYFSEAGSNQHPLQTIAEDYRFERDASSLGGSVTWQDQWLFSGLAGGTSLEHPEDYHLGGFVGLGERLGPITSSVSWGLFRNEFALHAGYWEAAENGQNGSAGLIADEGAYVSKQRDRETTGWELRFAAGLRYDGFSRVAPYLSADAGWVRFWPKPEESQDNRILGDYAFGGGIEFRIWESLPIRPELKYGTCYLPDGFRGKYVITGLGIAKEL